MPFRVNNTAALAFWLAGRGLPKAVWSALLCLWETEQRTRFANRKFQHLKLRLTCIAPREGPCSLPFKAAFRLTFVQMTSLWDFVDHGTCPCCRRRGAAGVWPLYQHCRAKHPKQVARPRRLLRRALWIVRFLLDVSFLTLCFVQCHPNVTIASHSFQAYSCTFHPCTFGVVYGSLDTLSHPDMHQPRKS